MMYFTCGKCHHVSAPPEFLWNGERPDVLPVFVEDLKHDYIEENKNTRELELLHKRLDSLVEHYSSKHKQELHAQIIYEGDAVQTFIVVDIEDCVTIYDSTSWEDSNEIRFMCPGCNTELSKITKTKK